MVKSNSIKISFRLLFVWVLFVVIQITSPHVFSGATCEFLFKNTTLWQQSFWGMQERIFIHVNQTFLQKSLAGDQSKNEVLLEFLKASGLRLTEYGQTIYPSVKSIRDEYYRRMKVHVKDGKIKESEILTPVMYFARVRNGITEIITIPLGGHIPAGFSPLTKSNFPDYYKDDKSDLLYFETLRKKQIPISYSEYSLYLSEGMTNLLHDVVHLSIISKHPEISKELYRISQSSVFKEGDSYTGFRTAIYLTNEMLLKIDRNAVGTLFSKYGIKENSNIDEISRLLFGLTDEKINNLFRDIDSLLKSETEFAGGVTSDTISLGNILKIVEVDPMFRYISNDTFSWLRVPHVLIYNSKAKYDIYRYEISEKDKQKIGYRIMAADSLAEVIQLLNLYSRFQPADWFRAVEGMDFSKDSEVYKFIVSSGLINSKNWRDLKSAVPK